VNVRATQIQIDVGDRGIERTLHEMRRLVLASARDPSVIDWAQSIVRFVPERDPDGCARAFLGWVRSHTRYTEDPVDVELVKSPAVMLAEWRSKGRIAADCDDQVTLLAAGMHAVGVPTEFVVVAADASTPDDFSHVLLQYAGTSGWTTMDPIVRGTGLGFVPPGTTRSGYFRDGRLQGSRAGPGLLPVVGVVALVWWVARRRRG
jgi:hypothetical protein